MERYTMFLDWKNQHCENDYITQSNLEKEKQSWRNQAPGLQTILQSYINKDSMVLAQKQK